MRASTPPGEERVRKRRRRNSHHSEWPGSILHTSPRHGNGADRPYGISALDRWSGGCTTRRDRAYGSALVMSPRLGDQPIQHVSEYAGRLTRVTKGGGRWTGATCLPIPRVTLLTM